VDVLHANADRQLARYEWFRENGFPPQISFTLSPAGITGFGGPGAGGLVSTSRYRASFGLTQARGSYSAAIQGLLRMGQLAADQLLALEQGLTRTYYLELGAGKLSPGRCARSRSPRGRRHRRSPAPRPRQLRCQLRDPRGRGWRRRSSPRPLRRRCGSRTARSATSSVRRRRGGSIRRSRR
jgi:hypothetical protein